MLLAIGGSAVALLAVVLAAIALVAGFLEAFFGDVIAFKGGTVPFFRPFRDVAVMSAAAAVVGFVGAINGASGTDVWRDALLGLGAWLMVAAIVSTVGLVDIFIRYAKKKREFDGQPKP